MYGVGYPVLEARDRRPNTRSLFLLVLLAGKIVGDQPHDRRSAARAASSRPRCSWARCSGSAFGLVAHALLPGIAGPAGAYGLVGMGAVFAAAARAPITAVLIIFELTGDYRIILPLMLAVVIATGARPRGSRRDTIYTLKLRRRGIDLLHRRPASPMEAITVAEAMRPTPEPDPSPTHRPGRRGRAPQPL